MDAARVTTGDLGVEVAAAIQAHRAAIVAATVALRNPTFPVPVAEVRQFAHGFLHLMESAAIGDTAARDAYLVGVIPGVRASGFSFEATLEAMVRIAMAIVTVLPSKYHLWLASFCGDYTARLIGAWDRSRGP